MAKLGAALHVWARSLLGGGPQYLVLHVNSVCNAACRMCFTWDRMMEHWDASGIALEHLRSLARSMEPLPQLTVSGGEPLLRKDLGEILQAFHDEAGTRFFTVPTNSLRPDLVGRLIDRMTSACPQAYLNFCLPFHGDASQSASILGVEQAYERFLETYRLIQERRRRLPNVSCVLNFVMSRFNCDDYAAIIDRARREFPEAPLGIAHTRGKTHEKDAGDFPLERYRAAHAYLADRPRARGGFDPYTLMFDSISGQMSDTVAAVVAGERANLACTAGRRLLVVYDDGSVYPCELLDVVGMPRAVDGGEVEPASACLGDLADFGYDMAALLRSQRAQEVIRWIGCHDCACTWESAIYNRIVNSPGELMQLGARVARRLAARPAAAGTLSPPPA